MMREKIRIIVVDDAAQSAELSGDLLQIPRFARDDSGVTALALLDGDPQSLRFLVEWFQKLAGAEWQWS
jgi:hypothetical protein